MKCQLLPIHYAPPPSQVMHEVEGWQGFRAGYGSDMFRYLAATYPKAPWILSSATLDDDCINSIVESLGTKRLVCRKTPLQ